jgi:hypothetical protein
MTQIIELYVSSTGETRLATRGFTGASCQAASQFLEAALGVQQQEQFTSEYYRTANGVATKLEVCPSLPPS